MREYTEDTRSNLITRAEQFQKENKDTENVFISFVFNEDIQNR